MSKRLRKRNYRILEAENGEQAIHLAQQFSLGAILLGVSEQRRDGLLTLRALREESSIAKIPIVVLSLLSPEDRADRRKLPIRGFRRRSTRTLLLAELARLVKGSASIQRFCWWRMIGPGPRNPDQFRTGRHRRLSCTTLRHAIELCESVRPDLVILDLALPDGHGLDLIDWLRTRKELRSLPLVVYSAREVASSERGLFQLGPTEFLTKTKVQPVDVEALVFTMLRRYRPTDAARDEPVKGSV